MRQETLIVVAPFVLGTQPDFAKDDKRSELRALSRLLDLARHALPARDGVRTGAVRGPAVAEAEPIVNELIELLGESSSHFAGIHYLSFLLIDDDGPTRPAYVLLEMVCDGSANAARDGLARRAQEFSNRLFAGCEGFEPEHVGRFLRRHTVRPTTRYVAFPSMSVREIRTQAKLRGELRSCFEAQRPGELPAEQLSDAWLRAADRGGARRLSPTSASSIWRRVGIDHREGREVAPCRRPPFWVRWSLHTDVWREQLSVWTRRLFFPAVACCAAAGFHTLRGAPFEWPNPVFWGLALGIAAVRTLLSLWIAVRERPRALRAPATLRVAGTFLWDWLVAIISLAVALGVVLAASSIAARATPLSALAVATAIGAAAVAFTRAKLPHLVPCAAGFGLAALVFLPGDPVSLRLLVAPALSLVLSLVAYVMAGARGLCAIIGVSLAGVGAAALAPPRVLPDARWAFWALLVATLASLCWVVRWLIAVRRLEAKEIAAGRDADGQRPGVVSWDTQHLDRVQQREDLLFQNHLAVVTPLKSGKLRRRTLQRVLRAVNLLARIHFNRGDLGGIRTIHFASFLMLPDDERLLLLANYDGGFGSYLHEFNSVSGVTAVWSNCLGFPSAFFLVGDGASDEQRFKAFARRHQAITSGWYSAYPTLSIGDIEAATLTHRDLTRPIEDRLTWYGRQQVRFGRPLSEAECDLALRRL